jgi:DNA topoisomerase IA
VSVSFKGNLPFANLTGKFPEKSSGHVRTYPRPSASKNGVSGSFIFEPKTPVKKQKNEGKTATVSNLRWRHWA